MARRGRWIYSISGETLPSDAGDDFATKAEAEAAAVATYWPPETRKLLREQHAKTGGYKLRFHVGLVVVAGLRPIPGHEIVTALVGEQSATSDHPAGWPDADENAVKTLELQVHAVVVNWLRQIGETPGWDSVTFEPVEVDA